MVPVECRWWSYYDHPYPGPPPTSPRRAARWARARARSGLSYPAYPVCRNNTVFVTSLVPRAGEVDAWTAWYGAADANVATAVITATLL